MARPRRPPRRGALSNPTGRYEPYRRVPEDEHGEPVGVEPPPRTTTVIPQATRTLITRNESPDVPFDRSINPYQGCEHGCVYCFARRTHAYHGLSPGLDFETRIFSRPDAPERLRRELGRRGYRCETIVLGANTDPYQPVERHLRITRGVLEVLAACRHPVGITTKSALVLRDLDLLAPLAARRLVRVFVSLTTLDAGLARRLEPRAPTPERRVEVLAALAAAGVPAGVLPSPMIPGLNDTELEALLEAGARAGATSAGYQLLRLPGELGELFAEWLEAHYPEKAARVLSLVRQTRGGRLNQADFGLRMRGTGPYAELLARRFEVACRRLGLATELEPLEATQFQPPPREARQTRLFA